MKRCTRRKCLDWNDLQNPAKSKFAKKVKKKKKLHLQAKKIKKLQATRGLKRQIAAPN